jgi:hypothetical protein
MNERIRQLMEEAIRFRLDVDSKEYEAQVSPEDLEVFAELLIQECAEQVKNLRVNDYGISGAEIIREHFGVEE